MCYESVTAHRVPHKRITSACCRSRFVETLRPDLAWCYDFSIRELLAIAGLVSVHNEKVDVFLDGRRLERPPTNCFKAVESSVSFDVRSAAPLRSARALW